MSHIGAQHLVVMDSYRLGDHMMRYSVFIPRLYNLCRSLGFEAGKVLPSRAFCSDESQGFPIIMIAKHFGTFPFNHGRVGGIMATDRHGAYAEHGKDLVIIHASHVAYNPLTQTFGAYRRLQTETQELGANCGKIDSVLGWYLTEYRFARDNIFVERSGADWLVDVDNLLLRSKRGDGLYLHLDQLLDLDARGRPSPMRVRSTSQLFRAAGPLLDRLRRHGEPSALRRPLGDDLAPEWFHFQRDVHGDEEGRWHLEQNLLGAMPWILSSPEPMLAAAKVNTQVEYDRVFRSILQARCYRGKRVLYIAGLNVDISPEPGRLFPLTKFIPWAAYVQQADGSHENWEQDEVYERLAAQSIDNPDQVDLEAAIRRMSEAREVQLPLL